MCEDAPGMINPIECWISKMTAWLARLFPQCLVWSNNDYLGNYQGVSDNPSCWLTGFTLAILVVGGGTLGSGA